MKKRFVIAGIVIVMILAVFVIKLVRVTHDDDSLLVSGNVEVTEVNMGFKSPGRVLELLVEEGQKVNKGDRLAVLDSAEVRGYVSQNRALLNETVIRLDELKVGARPQELQQAEAGLKQTEAELSKAKKDFERAESLFKQEAITAQQMDTANKIYDIAISQHKKATEALSLVKEGPRKEAIKAAEQRVRQAEAVVRVSEERLKDTVIYAPASGVILRKNVEAGEMVSAGMPVYTIGDLENPWIKVYVKEDKLGLVRLGQKAEIKTDSYKDKTYEGVVTNISSEAEFTPKNVQTREERVKLVFGVKVSVKNINNELKPGMPADVKIMLR